MPSQPEQIALPTLPQAGELLDQKYRIERVIGRGGMGIVYLARHEMLDQPVAIKLLLPEVAANKAAVSRFINEARSSAKIRNEHIAKVIDVNTLANGSAFMVLEYLEGTDLSTLVSRHGPLRLGECIDYILQALEAIAQAHTLGIVHRDLKPANLFLANCPDGTVSIKVLDFGISKAVGPVSDLTATNAMLGSPSFMSPEQVRSSKTVDARSDIWSVGICLFQLLTTELPFKGENFGEVFAAILEATPPLPSTLRRDLPSELDAVIARCLERNLEMRYANVAELADALTAFGPPDAKFRAEKVRRILFPSSQLPTIGRVAPEPFGISTPHSLVSSNPALVSAKFQRSAVPSVPETRAAPSETVQPQNEIEQGQEVDLDASGLDQDQEGSQVSEVDFQPDAQGWIKPALLVASIITALALAGAVVAKLLPSPANPLPQSSETVIENKESVGPATDQGGSRAPDNRSVTTPSTPPTTNNDKSQSTKPGAGASGTNQANPSRYGTPDRNTETGQSTGRSETKARTTSATNSQSKVKPNSSADDNKGHGGAKGRHSKPPNSTNSSKSEDPKRIELDPLGTRK